MKKIAVFDTETTKLWDFKKTAAHPSQPYPVETSIILYDDQWQILEEALVYTIPPDGASISPGAEKIHGITNEKIHKIGKPMDEGMLEVQAIMAKADYLVGFNVDFDAKVLASAAQRSYGQYLDRPMFDVPRQTFYCVMKKLTPVLKLPHKNHRRGGYKWPTLTEAVHAVLKKEHSTAHAAREDVRATAELFLRMMQTSNLKALV